MYRKDYRFFEENQSTGAREHRVRAENALPSRLLSHLEASSRESPFLPSLILCFQGDHPSLNKLKERLGEMDVCDTMEGELWFFLGGVQQPDASSLQSLLKENLLQEQGKKVKAIVLRLTKEDEARKEALKEMRRHLAGMKEEEIKIL
jgi:hypothetical protein